MINQLIERRFIDLVSIVHGHEWDGRVMGMRYIFARNQRGKTCDSDYEYLHHSSLPKQNQKQEEEKWFQLHV
jgi:hypothetical protein